MSEGRNSGQMTLNVFGFMFLVLGMGAEGRWSFMLIGLAIVLFIAAIIMAVAGAGRRDRAAGED
jgi:hypothetical protein